MRSVNLAIIEELSKFLTDAVDKKKDYCEKETDFTRKRVFTFELVVVFILNMIKKSLAIELVDFFSQLGAVKQASKSAFSMARKKLKSIFFSDWNKVLIRGFYREAGEHIRYWKGHTLLAIDGSTAHLFDDAGGKLAAYFGRHRGKVMGRLMSCYDVENGLNVLGDIYPISTSENEVARHWQDVLSEELKEIERPIFLYDAKFPGASLMYQHLQKKQDFVIRCSLSFNIYVKRFVASGELDQQVDFHFTAPALKELKALGYAVDKDSRLTVRPVRIELEGGTTEVLITSLLDKKQYPYEAFQPLYFKRWGVETNYDAWKNKVQLELISGHSVAAVLQEVRAGMMLLNLQNLIELECKPEMEELSEKRAHDYEVNQNVAIGCMKHRVVQLFLSDKPEEVLDELKRLFCRHVEPIRKNRKVPRKKRIHHLKGKYKTMTNYRKAV